MGGGAPAAGTDTAAAATDPTDQKRAASVRKHSALPASAGTRSLSAAPAARGSV